MPRWERSPFTRVAQSAALFAAFGLALSSTLAAPLFRNSGYLVVSGSGKGGTVWLGTFGWCNDERCSGWSVGYDAGKAVRSVLRSGASVDSYKDSIRCLIMTPFVSLFALLAALVSAFGSSVWSIMWTVILALVTCITAVAGTALNAWLFTTLGRRARDEGASSARFGLAMWLMWGATGLALLVPILAMVEACLSRRRRNRARGTYVPVKGRHNDRDSVYTESAVALYDYDRESASNRNSTGLSPHTTSPYSATSTLYPSSSVSSAGTRATTPSSAKTISGARGSFSSVNSAGQPSPMGVMGTGHGRPGSVDSMGRTGVRTSIASTSVAGDRRMSSGAYGVDPRMSQHGIDPRMSQYGVDPRVSQYGVEQRKSPGVDPRMSQHVVDPRMSQHIPDPRTSQHMRDLRASQSFPPADPPKYQAHASTPTSPPATGRVSFQTPAQSSPRMSAAYKEAALDARLSTFQAPPIAPTNSAPANKAQPNPRHSGYQQTSAPGGYQAWNTPLPGQGYQTPFDQPRY